MRAIWSGSISFGLVNIPVKLFSANEEYDLHFRLLHKKDHAPIRYARICRKDGEEVPYEDVVRGYEYQKGDYVVLTDEDFKQANVRSTKTIDIIDFTEESQIDSRYYEKPYYLEPDRGAEKPYALLREALRKSGKVGIAKFVLRNKEHLAVVKALEEIIVVEQLRFAQELRDTHELKGPDLDVQEKEIKIALALIEQLSGEFDPTQYSDSYREDLEKVIEQKAKGKKPGKKGAAPAPTPAGHLMSALRESLEKQHESVKRQKAAAKGR